MLRMRAEISPFIKQRRINSGWRAILEAFFVQASQDRFLFRPDPVSVPAKAVARSLQGKGSYGDPDS